MNAHLTVTAAREQLARAELDAATERHDELVRQLEAVRTELIEARSRYRELSDRIKSEREFRNRTQMLINQVVQALGEHSRQKPEVADYLPRDPEVVAWNKRRRDLERERDKLIARRDATPQTPVIDAVLYEGPSGIIARLEHAEQNLLGELSGSRVGKLPEGGIFGVL